MLLMSEMLIVLADYRRSVAAANNEKDADVLEKELHCADLDLMVELGVFKNAWDSKRAGVI